MKVVITFGFPVEEKKQGLRFGFNSAECSVGYLISGGFGSIAVELVSLFCFFINEC